ncbi:hypothetical protein ACQP1K_10160 [Sphaerimonospora sp. CA-214678]
MDIRVVARNAVRPERQPHFRVFAYEGEYIGVTGPGPRPAECR